MQYTLIGSIMPAVQIDFDEAGEKMISQAGGMLYMTDGVTMDTDTSDGILKGLGRMFAGQSLFLANYTADKAGERMAFASNVAGQILPVNVSDHSLIIQKGAFLCAESGVQLETVFQKKAAAGFFGGEGFILQKISGEGMCFLAVDGDKIVMDLAEGESVRIQTGNVVAFEESVTYDIEAVQGMKNIFFAGEGIFMTKLTGPGRVVIQTLNLSEFASEISTYIPTSSSSS